MVIPYDRLDSWELLHFLGTPIAWLLQRSPNILLIPGTSSRSHLRENLAVADIRLDDEAISELDSIGAEAA